MSIELLIPNAIQYEKITRQTFTSMLARLHHSSIITITTLTTPRYRKTNCPYKNNLLKLAQSNGSIVWNYEGAVNRKREKEGVTPDFVAGPRAWGGHHTEAGKQTPIITHINKEGELKAYIEFKTKKVLWVKYLTKDFNLIPTEEVTPWLTPHDPHLRQEVSQPIIPKDYEIKNILTIKIKGRGYVITH